MRRIENIERKLDSKQTVHTLPDYEEKVLINWLSHYNMENNYGKGSGSSYNCKESRMGNYGIVCSECNHITEVEINHKVEATVSMKSNHDNFISTDLRYSGVCPHCGIYANFKAIPILFVEPITLLNNKKYIVGFSNEYSRVGKKTLIFSFRTTELDYRYISKYIKSTFMFDLPLTWVFDADSYIEVRNKDHSIWISFKIYTDKYNLPEAIIDIENFAKELCPLDEIMKNYVVRKDYWYIMKNVINLMLEPKWT